MNNRYQRQSNFAPLGIAGQKRLASSRIAIVGIGALGSVIAERLTRAGVGSIRLIDRDWVELSNLSRQTLFTEEDARSQTPKAVAAANHLLAINSEISITTEVADLIPSNAENLLRDIDLILDGTDNFETRFLINDVSLELGLPWIHGGCVGASGQVVTFIPGHTACFRCIMPEPLPADQMATCDINGVLGPAVSIIASWQSMEAIKYLSGNQSKITHEMIAFDFWNNEVRKVKLDPKRLSASCPACGAGARDFLNGKLSTSAQVLCGRNAVQIQSSTSNPVDLGKLKERLSTLGIVSQNPFLLKFEKEGYVVTVFKDGRSIIAGTEDPIEARRIYSQWIGV